MDALYRRRNNVVHVHGFILLQSSIINPTSAIVHYTVHGNLTSIVLHPRTMIPCVLLYPPVGCPQTVKVLNKQGYFNVDTTSSERYGRFIDVE